MSGLTSNISAIEMSHTTMAVRCWLFQETRSEEGLNWGWLEPDRTTSMLFLAGTLVSSHVARDQVSLMKLIFGHVVSTIIFKSRKVSRQLTHHRGVHSVFAVCLASLCRTRGACVPLGCVSSFMLGLSMPTCTIRTCMCRESRPSVQYTFIAREELFELGSDR